MEEELEKEKEESFDWELEINYDLIKEEDIKNFMKNIPKAPDKELVKRLLVELPQQITYIENLILEYKKALGDAKVALKTKNKLLKIEKSEIRKRENQKFKQEYKMYTEKARGLLDKVAEAKEDAALKKVIQEMIKALKPEKPTKEDLDDAANIGTKKLQEEINELEKRIVHFQMELEALVAKKEFYNNMWVTLRKYTDVIVNEMKMLGEK